MSSGTQKLSKFSASNKDQKLVSGFFLKIGYFTG